MKKLTVVVVLVAMIGSLYWISKKNPGQLPVTLSPSASTQSGNPAGTDSQTQVIATNLDTPWAVAVLPDGSLLVTERPGRVRFIDAEGKLSPTLAATLPGVKEIGEGGLLGIALDPTFSTNKTVYLYYTYAGAADSLNRVVKMTYDDATHTLSGEQTILDAIPGNSNHNGGRIKFGPDKRLYIGTGDAQEPSLAQNTTSLGGKILRVTTEGKAAPGNPFNSPIYSYGHRNVQGLAWASDGSLWATEHGRSGVQSGLDELNRIEAGKNYGWPDIEGNKTQSGMETPKQNSGSTTWAPSGAAFLGTSLFFSGLRGQTLYEAVIKDGKVLEVKEHLKDQVGRIREVVLGPNNMLIITTSNQDGRGKPIESDDRVILVDPTKI